jgi:LmbE family N-acetylglucosaminyl deacetylase
MLNLGFNNSGKYPLQTVLCLGAHSDDIEIGCGGSILRLLAEYEDLNVWWVVLSGNLSRQQEAQKSAEHFLQGAKQAKILLKDFRDGYFPYEGAAVKDSFEELKQQISPDLIFTHCKHDLHQDHRLSNELTWNTWREHLILEYEIPKYDGDLGTPNFFVHLDEAVCQQKVKAILRHFYSQKNKNWFNEETFFALMRLRGIESRAPGKYAEAFYCRKIILEP